MKIVNKTNYITSEGFKKLVDELNELILKERPEITKVIQWAAGNGDRSENADYLYGRKRLREIDKRCNFLRKRIELANVVEIKNIKSTVIKFGATVTLLNDKNEYKTITIVGVDEVDTKNNKISWQSPLGKSLLNKEVGDEIEFKSPSGLQSYEIADFTYKSK